MYKCKRCGKTTKTLNGFYGHYRFKHGIEYKTGEPLKETPYMKAITKRLEEIWRISQDKKEFEEWRRAKMKADRLKHYEIWRQMNPM